MKGIYSITNKLHYLVLKKYVMVQHGDTFLTT